MQFATSYLTCDKVNICRRFLGNEAEAVAHIVINLNKCVAAHTTCYRELPIVDGVFLTYSKRIIKLSCVLFVVPVIMKSMLSSTRGDQFCASPAIETRANRMVMMVCLLIVLYQSIGSYCLVEVKREKEVTLLACLGGRFFILFLS